MATLELAKENRVNLLEEILDRNNLNGAYAQVLRKKGTGGVDGMQVGDLKQWLKENKEKLLESLRKGKYIPQPVKRVEIPKPDGGIRKLGIPTVLDRLIRQAIAQVMTPIFEKIFSARSYGFRPGRNTQQAIKQAEAYYREGYTKVVGIDLAQYFDTVNHDMLINMVREEIKDERVIALIRRYLKSGVMEGGIVSPNRSGTPQGGKSITPVVEYLSDKVWPTVGEAQT
ncbi:reverse transcriptase domain-containing protein [Pectinatus haikarae]|uniref:Group II intron reverse transcriptase/maturase n=1 Tax=Pectinatus haikarae TaxID=349096 RepID=A0ABT9Y888_9FIRM|nr:reverse transcriptase domain-containing protein [Pectinatus haikarae]MDQ0204049.1 group II intron reverse transcriptase/maturase [Pectinatus haikarae]